jgi:hypothetical protein
MALPAMSSQQKWLLKDFRRVSLHAKAISRKSRIDTGDMGVCEDESKSRESKVPHEPLAKFN